MGKLYDSLLSGTSGRTGRIVVANVFGNEITRIRPKKRSTPPTGKQLLIQQRMKNAADFMQSYKSYALLYYGKRMGMSSRYNLAMTNLLNSFTLDYATSSMTIQYPNVIFSKGILLGALPSGLTLPTPATLEINWQNNSGTNLDRETDWVQILVAAEGEAFTLFVENGAQRSAGTYTVNLPGHFQGKDLHVWMAFRNTTEEMASNSTYVGSIS